MTSKYPLDQTFSHQSATHDFQIHWTHIGDSALPPLVLIHGTPWSSIVWEDLVSSLCSRYHIYIYDHPGFGVSPSYRRTKDAVNADQIDLDGSLVLRAEASAALFKHWNLPRRPHVVAHDNGGLVSMRLLLQYGIEFASLSLIDVVVVGPFGLPFFKLVAENHSVFEAIPPHMSEGLVRAYVKSAAFKPISKEIEDRLSSPWLANGGQGTRRFLQEMVQAHNRDVSDVEKDYASVGSRTPVKIIWGADDAWLPVEIASRLKKALNAQEMVLVEEAAHLIHYDQPSKLALEVGIWLGQHS